MLKQIEVDHYPFQQDTDLTTVRQTMGSQYRALVSQLPLDSSQRTRVLDTLYEHYIDIEGLGIWERNRRQKGVTGANLFYHNLDHFLQTGFDTTAIAIALLKRSDFLSSHLSVEGLLALPIAGIRHDMGYITANPYGENLASHAPIHVQKSMESTATSLDVIPFPSFIDQHKLKEFAIQGQHNTHFPWTEERSAERRAMLAELPKDMRLEAMIIRLATQLADLGGQTIRVDQHPTGAIGLRKELEETMTGLGYKIMGTDELLLTNAQKFNVNVVLPSVGKTARAFFGSNNTYAASWKAFNDRQNK